MKWHRLLNPVHVYKRRKLVLPQLKAWRDEYLVPPITQSRIILAEHGLGLTSNDRRIASLKDKHRGRVGWLIGNGPSVRTDDLERLRGALTFCCNRFHLAYDATTFRPTYTFSADKQVIEDFGQEIVDQSGAIVVLCCTRRPDIAGEFIWVPIRLGWKLAFEEKPYRPVMPAGATLIVAMQVGYYMGIRRFFLYGVDHEFDYQLDESVEDPYRRASGDANHFIPDYRSGRRWAPPSIEKAEAAYEECDRVLRQEEGWLKNATRGGKVEVLERVGFDAAVSDG